MTQINPERCRQLRALHTRLSDEIKRLQESIHRAEQEGVSNPLEMLNTVKQLKASLHTVSLELANCPVEADAETQRPEQAKLAQAKQTARHWFKAEADVSVQSDEEDPVSLIDDEH